MRIEQTLKTPGVSAVAQVAPMDRAAVGRGVTLLAGTGAVVGGVAGTLDWPFVGTLFCAVPAAIAGALVGAVDGAALMLVAHRTRSRWAARAVSGVVGAAAIPGAVLFRGQPVLPVAAAASLVALAVVMCAGLGPVIAFGADPITRTGRPWQPARWAGRALLWGLATGGALGAVAGILIGIRAHLPTAPFAAVEGGTLGAAAGTVLACAAVALAAIPRVRARQ